MRRTSHLIIAALLVLAGCSKEYEPVQMQEPKEFEFTLEAELGGLDGGDIEGEDTKTKASATTVVRLKWAKDDEISVINLTTGKALGGSLRADKEGTTTTFSGTLSGTVRNGDKMIFLYPSQGYTQEQDYEPVTIDLSQQKGNSKENVPICVYATANASGTTFSSASATFKFLMSYLQLSFANLEKSDAIKEVKVENIGNAMTLALSSDGLNATPSVGTITMTPSSYTTSSTGTKAFYISFAQSPSVSGRKITVWSEGGLKAGNFSGSKLAANTSYTSTVADFKESPVPFADDAFKAYCVQNFDTDGDGEISYAEASMVKRIDCSAPYVEYGTPSPGTIMSLDGVQYFTSLEELNCDFNQLTSLDVSKNKALLGLSCQGNQLNNLDLSENTALVGLVCARNQLGSLDVSKHCSLINLFCGYNHLTTLDVSKNTALISLHCRNNQLTRLDVRNNAVLDYLVCNPMEDEDGNNLLQAIYIDKNSKIFGLISSMRDSGLIPLDTTVEITTL